MTNKNCGIYKITNPLGSVYIGQSRDLIDRKQCYARLNCKKQYKIYNSIKKYGWENHQFDIIEYCSIEDLNRSERFWQDEFNVLDRETGLNLMLTDADEKPRVISEETREKMRESGKLKFFSEEHRNNLGKVWAGKKHTLETKAKMGLKGELHPGYGKPAHNRGKQQKSTAGGNNPCAKLIMCTETGLFYYHRQEACDAYNINYSRLGHMLRGTTNNITSLIYV